MDEVTPIPLDEREKLILMAARLHGPPPDGPIRANCGRVVGQALVWAGLWSDDVKWQLQGAGEEDASVMEAWYATLIAMTKHIPACEKWIEVQGNLGSPDGDLPAAPAFTGCGLTTKGWELAEKMLAERPHLVGQSRKFLGGF